MQETALQDRRKGANVQGNNRKSSVTSTKNEGILLYYKNGKASTL